MGLRDVQLFLRPDIIELIWGHPALALLPVDEMRQATEVALARDGVLALCYGAEQGPARLIEQLCARMDRLGYAPPPEQVMITGGTSQALDMLCTLLTRPGDVVLVESPVYHLALRIFRDHDLDLVPVPGAGQGGVPLFVEALGETLEDLARQGRAARLLYTVPTYNNPTGKTMSMAQRGALVRLVQRERRTNHPDLLVLEDDAYHELWYDEPPPSSLYELAPAGPIVRLASFSKVLAPGLRLGWLSASPEIVQRCIGCGMLDSGGGINHFTAYVAAAFIELGFLDRHVATLRAEYRERRDVLLAALAEHLPSACHWERLGGGFFAWVRLPPGVDGAAFLPTAEAAGVSYVPGACFYAGEGGDDRCRLAFTLVSHDDLAAGARRLGQALRER
ncbi:MAG TPA: PLP-dependent aminotransferase family protein [Chloroflexi bacterium]|nr:PLP-dependent aminotransferase family protein [Chloroflexota bacterium]